MTTPERIKALADYGVDFEDAMERFVDDEELYIECLRLFLADDNFTALEKAMAENDAQQAFHAAHGLKGVAANLALRPMQAAIAAIVESLRAGKSGALHTQYAAVLVEKQKLCALAR